LPISYIPRSLLTTTDYLWIIEIRAFKNQSQL